MTQTLLEGWCTDPWGLHEARWMSAGAPTKLVRDGRDERFEPVPRTEAVATPVPVAPCDTAPHGMDLRRSDQQTPDPRRAMATAASHILTRFSD